MKHVVALLESKQPSMSCLIEGCLNHGCRSELSGGLVDIFVVAAVFLVVVLGLLGDQGVAGQQQGRD